MPQSNSVVIATTYLGPNGGTGAHVLDSALALERKGFEVVVAVGLADSVAAQMVANVEVIPGLQDPKPTPAVRARLAGVVHEAKPDVVHVHHLFEPPLLAELMGTAPVVADVHNYVGCTSGRKYFRHPGDECRRAHGPGCLPSLALKGCAHTFDPRGFAGRYVAAGRQITALAAVDAVVAHSRFVEDHLHANGITRTSVAPLFLADPPTASAPPPGPNLLFTGRLTANKGLETLLEALANLDAATHLEVAGDGWWRAEAESMANRLGVAGRVTFLGWLAPAALHAAYRRARVVVVPSWWPEPFGLVGLEAMAHGRAIVGSATGGIPEWLVDGEVGRLVPPGDATALSGAITEILSDAALCEAMASRGPGRLAQSFSENSYLGSLTRTYRDAAAHSAAIRGR